MSTGTLTTLQQYTQHSSTVVKTHGSYSAITDRTLMSQQQLLEAYLASVDQIERALNGQRADTSENLIHQAQVVTQGLDSIGFFYRPNLVDRQIQTLSTIQRLVYLRHDIGPLSPTVADWCLQRWLWIAQYHTQDARIMQGKQMAHVRNHDHRLIDLLTGIGSWWLSRAQPSLARIHAVDGSSSSSSGGYSSRPGTSSAEQPATGDVEDSDSDSDSEDEDGLALQAQQEADARLNTADYVEARGLLLPAIDYLRRAIETTDAAGQAPTGRLLTMVSSKPILLHADRRLTPLPDR